jgi:hypothetical protein
MSQHPDDSRDAPSSDASSGPDEGITDEKLPADLQPTDDNPLAQPLEGDDVKSPEELDVLGGKVPEQRGDDGADRGSADRNSADRDEGGHDGGSEG